MDRVRSLAIAGRSSLAWIAGAVLLLGCSQSPDPAATGRGFLVLAVDSLRADHLGCYGYDRDTSPSVDRLASAGVLFEQAFSTSPQLLPAHVSLVTGCDPNIARRTLPPAILPTLLTTWFIPFEAPRAATEFLSRGFATAAFLDHPWIAPLYGFAPGFSEFRETVVDEQRRPEHLNVPTVLEALEQWLRNQPRGRDWFAYAQLHDLGRTWHNPDPKWDTFFEPRPELSRVPPIGEAEHLYFAVPRSKWSGGVRSLGEYEAQYDGAIRRLDQKIGWLLTKLQQQGRDETTTIILVGSYGLGFGESGLILDHGTLSDVDLRVPLIVRPAAEHTFTPGTRSPALASILDVAPTLLDYAGFELPSMHGVSLADVVAGRIESARNYVLASCGLRQGCVIMDERYCYEESWPDEALNSALVVSWFGETVSGAARPTTYLHDRQQDPFPGHRPGGTAEGPEVARLRAEMELWIDEVEGIRRAYQALNLFAGLEGVDSMFEPTGQAVEERER